MTLSGVTYRYDTHHATINNSTYLLKINKYRKVVEALFLSS